MNDNNKTKSELLAEISILKRENKELKHLEVNRERALEALRTSELTYQTIFESTGTGMLIIEEDMTISLANEGFVKLTGLTREEIEGKIKWTEFVEKGDLEKMVTQHKLRRTDPGLATRNYDFRLVSKDGSMRNISLMVDLIPGTQKSVASLIDITDRKQAVQALQESEVLHRQKEERYRNILDHMEEAYYEVDLKGSLTFFNNTAVKSLGYTDDVMTGLNFRQYADSENVNKLHEAYSRVFLTGESVKGIDWEIISKKSGKMPIESSISLMRDIQGKPVGFSGVIRDITERKKAEQALRESEARYRNILENMEEAYYEVDLKGNLTFFNSAVVKNLGYHDNVMMGMNFRQYVDKESERKLREAYSRVFLTGESVKGLDWEIISKESGKIPIESSISLMRDTQGNPIGFRGVIRDITERKRAEEALHDSEAKFRNLTETDQDAIVTIDMNGVITYANPAAKALAADMTVIGMALTDFLPPDAVEHHEEILKLRSSGFAENMSYESKVMRPQDNHPLYFDVKSSTLFNHGEPSGVLFVARDATERKRTEEEIRLMAIVDTLTGLFNRRGFIALAEQQMKTAVRSDHKLFLFFIDVDGLKFINDTWGHERGDQALKRTSIILKQTFRESDIIARLGGDEFAALVPDSPDLPEVILKRLQCRTDDENAASDTPYRISMSIGVADYDPSAPCSIHELMSRADQLMYHQKKGKKQTGQYP